MPKTSIISPEVKIKAVREYLEAKENTHNDAYQAYGENIAKRISEKYEMSAESLYKYAQAYRKYGEEALSHNKSSGKNIRRQRIAAYIEKLRNIDIKAILYNLPSQELRVVIDQAKIEVGEELGDLTEKLRESVYYESAVVERVIHLQLNETIGEYSEEEKTFLKSQDIAVNTYASQVGEYRKEVKKLLDQTFVDLQKQYRIQRKKLRDIVNQRCLKAGELENALADIKNDDELLRMNWEMEEVQRQNTPSRAAQIALYKLTVGKEIHQQRKNQYELTKKQRQENYTSIDEKKFIRISDKLLQSSDYHELILGLCALTGRRQIEVAKTGKFAINDDSSLVFSGQVKKRQEEAENKEHVIPILTSPQKILQAHAHLKQQLKLNGFSEEDSNRSYNNRLFTDEKTSKLKQNLFEEIYAKDVEEKNTNLRAIYATICYRLFQPEMSFRAYTAMILNHENMDSAASYDRYSVNQIGEDYEK